MIDPQNDQFRQTILIEICHTYDGALDFRRSPVRNWEEGKRHIFTKRGV